MPEIVNCPQCERKLRVPDDLLGQAVKCPTCGRTFTASVAPPASAAPLPLPGSPPAPAEPEPLQLRYEEAAHQQPAPANFPQEPRYGGYGEYESEFERRRLGLRSAALAAVSGPATALTVSAVIGIVFQALYILAEIAKTVAGPGKGGALDDPEAIAGFVGGCVGMTIALTLTVVCIIGAQKMKRLESYGWSMTASILMMIPCFSPCCVLGLPFGIWALVVLNDPQVKDAFQS